MTVRTEIPALSGGKSIADRVVHAFAGLLDSLKNFLFEDNPCTGAGNVPPVTSTRDCVLVIDASGSMLDDDWKPTRLDAAKDSAKAFVDRLATENPNARIALVAFGCRARKLCCLTAAKQRDALHSMINKIDIEGSTNMKAGLNAALKLLPDRQGTCQVVLLTDGHNTGSSPLKVAQDIKKFAVIECVGIGGSPGDVDESLLKRIASAHPNGRKRYRWIGQKDQLIRHFHNLAGGIRRL